MHHPSRFILFLAVSLCCAWTLWTTTKTAYDLSPSTSIRYEWMATQSDAPNIVNGVKDKSFVETLTFWTGPWALVVFDFYRPIPSVLWWAMYHVFGPTGLAWFLAILALSHFAATIFLWRFLSYLFRSDILATVTTCCFAIGLAHHLFYLATPAYALSLWIDLVEPWLLIAYIATCWTFVKYLRDGDYWLWVSMLCFVITICVKEAAYTFPLMALAFLWYERKLSVWKVSLYFIVIAMAGLVYRIWALQGMGTRFGSNGSWLQRALTEMGGGSAIASLFLQDGLPLFVAGAAMALLMVFLKRYSTAIIFALLSLGGFLLSAWSSAGAEDPFYYALLGSSAIWHHAAYTALWLMVVYFLITRPTREQLFGLAWVVITYSVLLGSSTTQHTLYITAVGFAMILAPFFYDIVHYVQRAQKSFITRKPLPVSN